MVDRIVDLQKFGCQTLISKSVLEFTKDPQFIIEETISSMVAKITYRMYVENLDPIVKTETKTYTHDHPKTWWDMFKETYKNHWWMRWKIRYVECTTKMTCKVTVKPTLIFPEAKKFVPVKLLGQPVRYAEAESESWFG